MMAMVAALGSSLNSAPPPPFTWASMKPGTSRSPPQVDDAIGADHLARADHGLDAPVAHQQRPVELDAGAGE